VSILVTSGDPPDSMYSLWYSPSINRFVDGDGYLLHDLHEILDVWVLDKWIQTKDYGLMIDKKGNLVELYYEEEAENYILPLIKNREDWCL